MSDLIVTTDLALAFVLFALALLALSIILALAVGGVFVGIARLIERRVR